jgi:ribosomal protein L37AE/L43A
MRTPRRNHNVYWALNEQGTVALPDAIPLALMKPATVKLYLVLLRHQKAARKNPFTAHSGELVLEANISPNSLTAARNELIELHHLIAAVDKPGEKGKWEYELLNPLTGGALLRPEQVVWADLSDWSVLEFFRRLRPDTRGMYDCPACKRAGELKIDMRPEKRGRWGCDKCGKYGGFPNAYKHAYGVDYPTASLSTRGLLQEIIAAEKARPQSEHPARPLPARPTQPVAAPPVVEQYRADADEHRKNCDVPRKNCDVVGIIREISP